MPYNAYVMKNHSKSIQREARSLELNVRRRHVRILLDKVLFLRFLRNLHGRFWGIVGISVMLIGFGICFLIRRDMAFASTAFSDFGGDVRTAPYFSGSVLFAAYGLWRWQKYLRRTLKRTMPFTGLIWLTMAGLYMVAFMPVTVQGWPNRLHTFGFALAGVSMLLTVVADWLLTKPAVLKGANNLFWRAVRLLSLALIAAGGLLAWASIPTIAIFNVSLVGELMVIVGYYLWIILKVYVGEGNRTILAKIIKTIVLID